MKNLLFLTILVCIMSSFQSHYSRWGRRHQNKYHKKFPCPNRRNRRPKPKRPKPCGRKPRGQSHNNQGQRQSQYQSGDFSFSSSQNGNQRQAQMQGYPPRHFGRPSWF